MNPPSDPGLIVEDHPVVAEGLAPTSAWRELATNIGQRFRIQAKA
jgi:hypothetical protein